MNIKRKLEVLQDIAEDMKNDAKYFNGRDFDGKNVGEYLGNQGAAIAALANILKRMRNNEKD